MAFQQFRTNSNEIVQPIFAAEPLFPDKLIPGGVRVVASQFPRRDQMTLTLAAGAVTSGSDRTLTLTVALTNEIPSGWTLDFGSGKLFTLSATAAVGATTMVGTLAANVAGGETTTFTGVRERRIEAGTLVGRTYTERDTGTAFGPWANGDEEVYLTAFQVDDATVDPEVTVVHPRTLIKETWLPGWSAYTSGMRAALRAVYRTVRG